MTVRTHQPHTVYVARRWADDWIEVNGLFCNWCKFAAAPDVAEAELSYNYGTVMRAGTTYFSEFAPLSYDDYYVRVRIEQGDGEEPIYWYGVVVETRREPQHGRFLPANQITGRQILVCRGLEYLLQRTVIDKSLVQDGTSEKTINRAIAFNLGSGDDTARFRSPNRSEESNPNGAFMFAEALDDTAESWSAVDIVHYLLVNYSPRDKDDNVQIPFEFDWAAQTILQALQPTLHAHGKTIKQLLDEIIDRRRLMSWYIDCVGTDETPTLKVFTFNADELTLPSERVVPSNPTTASLLDLDDESKYSAPRIVMDTSTKFDLVIARGERLGACFSISDTDAIMEADWDSTLQTAYNAGDPGASGNSYEQAEDHNRYRRTDKFAKVYRYFRVPPAWDGSIGAVVACPDPDDTSQTAPFWYPGMRFKPQLPLLTETDYTTATPLSPSSDTRDGSKAEYLRPFGVILDSTTSDYYYLDRMTRGVDSASLEAAGRLWSASVRMQDDAFGVILDVQGSMQHAIAATEFTHALSATLSGGIPAELNWQDAYVTVFAEWDKHVEGRWPETLTGDEDYQRRLVIEVPNARLDYLVPGTVVGVASNGNLQTASGGYVRDDRELLKDIARSAYEWYGQTRHALDFGQRDLVTDLRIGTLITLAGNATDQIEVNSVVTQMIFDLRAGAITFKTQFAELDSRA